jgi:nitrogen-specific signal transduction histidine kinase
MSIGKKELIGELKHEINSPLAAIRNALYLSGLRVRDPEVERYLKLADEEVSRIVMVLNRAHQMLENKNVCSILPQAAPAASAA